MRASEIDDQTVYRLSTMSRAATVTGITLVLPEFAFVRLLEAELASLARGVRNSGGARLGQLRGWPKNVAAHKAPIQPALEATAELAGVIQSGISDPTLSGLGPAPVFPILFQLRALIFC
jgi:hypothetical protein